MFGWQYYGQKRPPFAVTPGVGQESVWDYPRPPRLEKVNKRIEIYFAGLLLAETVGAYRVVETASPPTYYLPAADVQMALLKKGQGQSMCEWKGVAQYWDITANGKQLPRGAWSYAAPKGTFAPLRDYLAFYAAPMDRCLVGGAQVVPQPGRFYGGWITPELTGPFKGEPGSSGW